LNAAAPVEETASFAGFARLLGVKPSAVTALKQAGRLVLTDDGKRVRIAASRQRIAETADPSKAGVVARHAAERAAKAGELPPQAPAPAAEGEGPDDDDEAGTPGYQASRAKREHYAAMAAQRDYEVSIGKLMDAGEVAAAVAQAATTLRTQLEALPDTLAPQLAAITDEAQVRATLAEAIEHALEETARQFFAIARQGDA
jgi:hypothetical protein